MNEQVISFNTSKLAKAKGFPDVECTRYYIEDGKVVSANWVDIYEPKEYYPIVTQSLMQKWIREKQLWKDIKVERQGNYWTYMVYSILGQCFGKPINVYRSYEEALEIALLEALTLIK